MGNIHSLVLIALFFLIYFNDGVKAGCGRFIREAYGTIKSQPYFEKYPPYNLCSWIMYVPSNKTISLQFKKFQLEEHKVCVSEFLEINSSLKNGTIRRHGKFCGSRINNFTISDAVIIYIYLRSKSGYESNGFEMDFHTECDESEFLCGNGQCIDSGLKCDKKYDCQDSTDELSCVSDECGGLIEGGKGNISSPLFPDSYPPNKVCEWKFQVPHQHKIKLSFEQFEIEGGIGCPSDFLLIQSNSTEGKVFEYGKYCGHFGPSQISSKEKIIMTFVSDRSTEKKGFRVEYSIDKLTDFEASVLAKKEENNFPDEYESTISSTMTADTSTHAPIQPKIEKEQKETENVIASITNILSALTSLTKKVADIEERQIGLFNHYENMFNKFGKSIYNLQQILESQQ